MDQNLVKRNGTYYVRRQVGGVRRMLSTGQTSLELARQAARHINGEIDKGTVDELIDKRKRGPVPTYGEFAQTYLDAITTQKSVATARTDKNFLRPSMEAWETTRMDRIGVADCMALLASAKKTRAHNTVVSCVALSKAVFNHAIKVGHLTKNPWKDVAKGMLPQPIARTRVLALDEQRAFLLALPRDMRDVALMAMGAGLRCKELLGLDVKRHLDFEAGMIRLSKDIVKGGKKARAIPMLPQVRSMLLARITDARIDGSTVFQTSQFTINKHIRRACAATHIKGITLHDMRRTFGTRCAEKGVPMHVLQAWMGHSNISITSQFYLHSTDEYSQQVAMRLGEGFELPALPVATEVATHSENLEIH